jgi:hypothetical protein
MGKSEAMTREPPAPELSRLLDFASTVLAGGAHEHVMASASERAALARRLGVVEVRALEAMLDLRPWRGCGLETEGVLRATVVQTCVVSLELVESAIEAPISARYLPAAMSMSEASEPTQGDLDPFAEEPPEIVGEGRCIDLGELIVQHLAVAIDPYPRRPGAEFSAHIEAAASPDEGPFAKLAALKRPT